MRANAFRHHMQRLHWRQLVALGEMLLLLIVGFLPESCDHGERHRRSPARWQAFRKVDGYGLPARCVTDGQWCRGVLAFEQNDEPHAKDRMLRYFGIILLFALGAGIGSVSAGRIGAHAIWISACCCWQPRAAFIREDMEQNPLIESDISAIRKETAEIDRTLKQELKEERHRIEGRTQLTNGNRNKSAAAKQSAAK